MAQLRRSYKEFVKRSVEIVVIGPEKKKAFKNFWRKEYLPFIGLPDPDRKVLNQFGQEVSLVKLGRMPAQVISDEQGVIRYVYYGESMKDIPTIQQLLKVIDQIKGTDI